MTSLPGGWGKGHMDSPGLRVQKEPWGAELTQITVSWADRQGQTMPLLGRLCHLRGVVLVKGTSSVPR